MVLGVTMASEAPPSIDTGQVLNQLAILVPSFDPAVDNVEIWARPRGRHKRFQNSPPL